MKLEHSAEKQSTNIHTQTAFTRIINTHTHTHTHTTVLLLFWNITGTTRVSRYQKGKTRKVKTNLDLLEQEIVSGSGICWAGLYASLHLITDNHANIPPLSFFYRPDALPAAQQHQSTEGKYQNN